MSKNSLLEQGKQMLEAHRSHSELINLFIACFFAIFFTIIAKFYDSFMLLAVCLK